MNLRKGLRISHRNFGGCNSNIWTILLVQSVDVMDTLTCEHRSFESEVCIFGIPRSRDLADTSGLFGEICLV